MEYSSALDTETAQQCCYNVGRTIHRSFSCPLLLETAHDPKISRWGLAGAERGTHVRSVWATLRGCWNEKQLSSKPWLTASMYSKRALETGKQSLFMLLITCFWCYSVCLKRSIHNSVMRCARDSYISTHEGQWTHEVISFGSTGYLVLRFCLSGTWIRSLLFLPVFPQHWHS